MNQRELDAYLLASRPAVKPYSPFTQGVLSHIRQGELAVQPRTPSKDMWRSMSAFVWRTTSRRIVVLLLASVIITFVGLSGYAYAQGTDPFTLIKRWVSGDQIRVTYQDPKDGTKREFSHGTKRSYSDLAVSAFAELSLIDLLHFHAANAYTAPKNGVEHISDPFRIDYKYPRVGIVEKVMEDHVVLHLTYSTGLGKVEASRAIDERITVPRTQLFYYDQGKEAAMRPDAVGTLVEVFEDEYLRHVQGSGDRPVPVELFSVYKLSHSFESVREATTTSGPINAVNEAELKRVNEQQELYELGKGAWANVCLNNGADSCPHAFKYEDTAQSLFNPHITPLAPGQTSVNTTNPAALAWGEAVTEPTAAPRQYQLRSFEGRISKIAGDYITVKTPSGTQWHFQYAPEKQQRFTTHYGRPLKVGQLLVGSVIASVYDWDRRSFEDRQVYSVYRYK